MEKTIDKDLLWKGIIESLFDDFLVFFFPELSQRLDIVQGYEFLDKELQQLHPETISKNRRVDKLVKVFLANGQEQWILVHLEVQGYRDPSFAERMFIYFYRIKDKFRKPLTSLVIFTDIEPSYHPKVYRDEYFGTSIQFTFNTYKLLDRDPAKLAQDPNPFSIPLEVARKALEKGGIQDEDLFGLKVEIVKRMKKRGYPRQKIAYLLNFFHYYVRFENKENSYKFEKEINAIFKTREAMGITEIIEQELKRMATEEGRAEGLEKGLQQEKLRSLRKLWETGASIDYAAIISELPAEEVRNTFNAFQAEKKKSD